MFQFLFAYSYIRIIKMSREKNKFGLLQGFFGGGLNKKKKKKVL